MKCKKCGGKLDKMGKCSSCDKAKAPMGKKPSIFDMMSQPETKKKAVPKKKEGKMNNMFF